MGDNVTMMQDQEWYKVLTERQQEEIEFALVYNASFNHGTDGHHRLNLIAALALLLAEKHAALEKTLGTSDQ